MPNQQLITHARGHVTGEYAQNTVYLTGERVSDAGFYQNIRLSVQPSIGSAETCIRPAEDSGYNPRLFLGRMTDAPTEQILLSIASGGSGAIGYYSVYGYENGALRTLMTTAQYNNAFQYQVNYLAQYRVQVISLANGLEYLIDISGRSGEYLSSLYHTDGSLKAQQQGFCQRFEPAVPCRYRWKRCLRADWLSGDQRAVPGRRAGLYDQHPAMAKRALCADQSDAGRFRDAGITPTRNWTAAKPPTEKLPPKRAAAFAYC